MQPFHIKMPHSFSHSLSSIPVGFLNFEEICSPVNPNSTNLLYSGSSPIQVQWSSLVRRVHCAPEMITIRFAGWISGRIMSLQPDTDIQNLLWNGNRIRIRVSETLLLIFREFRLLEKVAHCTIIHLLSSFRSIFSAIYAMTPSLSMVHSLYHSVISSPS